MGDTTIPTTPPELTPTPTPTPIPATPPALDAATATVVELDVDEQALADLRKAQETEAAGTAAATDPATPGAATAADAAAALPGAAGAAAAAGAAPAAPAAPAGDADVITIPKARLDAVLKKRDTDTQEIAFLKGQLHVLENTRAAPAAPVPAAPAAPARTQAEQLADLDAAKVKLAERFDNGEISAKEWKTQETVLDQQARQLLIQPPAPARAPQPQDDPLYLDNLTAQLEDAHPYSVLIDARDGNKWAFLEAEARSGLLAQGVVLGTDGRSLYLLREQMAKLTDHYGPLWTAVAPEQAVAKVNEIRGVKPAGTPAAARPAVPAATGGLSTQAKQRADKLALAARHAPDPTAAGAAGGSGMADVSDAQIAQMSDEEITALPDTVRRRFIATG